MREEKNEYKLNRLKSALWKTREELDLLLIPFMGSGESEPAAQQAVNRELKPMRGRAQALQKIWQGLSVAVAFSCLESLRDFSPLKRILISMDWAGVANKVSPSRTAQLKKLSSPHYACGFIFCIFHKYAQLTS